MSASEYHHAFTDMRSIVSEYFHASELKLVMCVYHDMGRANIQELGLSYAPRVFCSLIKKRKVEEKA